MFIFLKGKIYPALWAQVVDGFFAQDPVNPYLRKPIATYQNCCCGVPLRMESTGEIEEVRKHYEAGHVLPPDVGKLRELLGGLG